MLSLISSVFLTLSATTLPIENENGIDIARALVGSAEFNAAARVLDEELEVQPHDLQALRLRMQLGVALGTADGLVEQATSLIQVSKSFEDRMLAARAALCARKPSMAREYLVGVNPATQWQYAGLEFLRGRILQQEGHAARATGAFRRCLDANPSHVDGLAELRKTLLAEGKYLEALTRWKAAYFLDCPESLPDDFQVALDLIERGLRGNHQDGPSRLGTAELLDYIGLQREAQAIYQSVRAEQPLDARLEKRVRALKAYFELEATLSALIAGSYQADQGPVERAQLFLTDVELAADRFLVSIEVRDESVPLLRQLKSVLYDEYATYFGWPMQEGVAPSALDPVELPFFRVLFTRSMEDGKASARALFLGEELGRHRYNRLRRIQGSCLTGQRPYGGSIICNYLAPINEEYPRILWSAEQAAATDASSALRMRALEGLGSDTDHTGRARLLSYHRARTRATVEHELSHVVSDGEGHSAGVSEVRALLAEIANTDDNGALLSLADLIRKRDRQLVHEATEAYELLVEALHALAPVGRSGRLELAELESKLVRQCAVLALQLEMEGRTNTLNASHGVGNGH